MLAGDHSELDHIHLRPAVLLSSQRALLYLYLMNQIAAE